jgi:transcriptional regulator with XRE-family HTH domain
MAEEMTLQELRQARKLTQVRMAKSLGITRIAERRSGSNRPKRLRLGRATALTLLGGWIFLTLRD